MTGTVFPKRDSAQRLAEAVNGHEILSLFPVGDNFAIQEMASSDSWIGQSMRDINVRRKLGISVAGVKCMLRGNVADPDAPLRDSDPL